VTSSDWKSLHWAKQTYARASRGEKIAGALLKCLALQSPSTTTGGRATVKAARESQTGVVHHPHTSFIRWSDRLGRARVFSADGTWKYRDRALLPVFLWRKTTGRRAFFSKTPPFCGLITVVWDTEKKLDDYAYGVPRAFLPYFHH